MTPLRSEIRKYGPDPVLKFLHVPESGITVRIRNLEALVQTQCRHSINSLQARGSLPFTKFIKEANIERQFDYESSLARLVSGHNITINCIANSKSLNWPFLQVFGKYVSSRTTITKAVRRG